MRNLFILVFCFFTGFLLISCVTNRDIISNTDIVSEKVDEPDSPGDSPVPAKPTQKRGIIYNSRSLSEGPLLLGSTEYLEGSVSEFSILYTIYFPMSGILIPDHKYNVSSGTRWKAVSDKLVQDVYFERALLNEDDEGKSWWYFKVEGDGYVREFEFLLDAEWKLMEMRYFLDGKEKSYIPSVDELNNLSNGVISYSDYKEGRETVETDLGSFTADHIVIESSEFWMSSEVIGGFVKSLLKEDDKLIATATLVEEKEGYETIFHSY